MDFLRLIRYPNLLMLALMQFIFRYGFYDLQGVVPALFDYQFVLLVISTVSIAAAGYIINDINDQATDHDNKPSKVIVGTRISETVAFKWYVALNILGVGIGFFLSHAIGRPWFTIIFMVLVILLYQYSQSWKRMMLLGNLTVSLLIFISVMILGVFDLFPILTPGNRPYLSVIFGVLLDYAVFGFVITLIREIIKDLEDVDGDYNQGMNTLPIALGVKRTAQVAFYLSIIPAVLVLVYVYKYFFETNLIYALAYSIIFVAAPLIYLLIKLWNASTKKHFAHLSFILKMIMFFGIISILVVSLNLRNNA